MRDAAHLKRTVISGVRRHEPLMWDRAEDAHPDLAKMASPFGAALHRVYRFVCDINLSLRARMMGRTPTPDSSDRLNVTPLLDGVRKAILNPVWQRARSSTSIDARFKSYIIGFRVHQVKDLVGAVSDSLRERIRRDSEHLPESPLTGGRGISG